jgi:hypothetical protein
MPSPRAAALAVVVGLAIGLYFALWFRWPTFLAVAIGATMAIVLLLFASSLADDPAAADAAWRQAAPDLAARERGATNDAAMDDGAPNETDRDGEPHDSGGTADASVREPTT